jgi:SAM-dependent methyltransferase
MTFTEKQPSGVDERPPPAPRPFGNQHRFAAEMVFPPDAMPIIAGDVRGFRERLSRQFYAFETEFRGISFTSVLDIGCGLAAFDAYLASCCGVRDVHLIDGDGRGRKVHGYVDSAQDPWGDVELGVRVVRANAPSETRVSSYSPPASARVPGVDLVISLRSWGHHYPVSTYVDLVRRCLLPGGSLVLDLRRGVAGRAALEAAGFRHLRTLADRSSKCAREVFCAS